VLAGLCVLGCAARLWSAQGQADDTAAAMRPAALPAGADTGQKQPDARPAGAAKAATKPATGAETMINVPVSTKIPAPPWPRANVPDFTLVARSGGGKALGTELRELDHVIQVDARRALASIEWFRSPTDVAGQAIGLFRMSIDDDQVRELRKVVADTKLFELRPSMKGHPGYTETRYTLIEPKARFEQLVNDSDHETNKLLGPLPKLLNVMLSKSFAHPERAALMGIKRVSGPAGEAFEVTITNVGVEKICFTDPRWITPTGPLQQATVLISEYVPVAPGEPTSLSWSSVALPALTPRPPSEPVVTLDPKGVWKATTAPWKKAAGKRYLAYFTFAHFPGEPTVGGVYRIRGRADSARLVIDP
jgi:hypothetical protein